MPFYGCNEFALQDVTFSLLATLVTISYAHLGVVWPIQVWCSKREFKTTLYIETLNLWKKSSSYIWINRVILPVVLYDYKTWSLTPKGKTKTVSDWNRILRRIFKPNRVTVTEAWRKWLNEEFHDDLYSSPNITMVTKSRRMCLEWQLAHVKAHELEWEKLKEQNPYGNPCIYEWMLNVP